MATVSNSPSLSEIQSVFGGSGTLREYVRGGSRVPNISQNNAISTNPDSLSILQFAGATDSGATALSVTISGQTYVEDLSPQYITSAVVTATATGGSGTKTYAWTHVSGTQFQVTGENTASLTTNIAGRATMTFTGTYRCTVTDASGSASATVTITHQHGTPM